PPGLSHAARRLRPVQRPPPARRGRGPRARKTPGGVPSQIPRRVPELAKGSEEGRGEQGRRMKVNDDAVEYRRPLERGELDPNRTGSTRAGMWAWMLQRGSALALIVLVALHLTRTY